MSIKHDIESMEILSLLLIAMFFAFTAGWYYAKGSRVLAIGLVMTGIGGSMAQNPVPTTLGDTYGAIGLVLFLGGVAILVGWFVLIGIDRFNRSDAV